MKYLTIMCATISGLMTADVKAFVMAGAGIIMAGTSSKSIFSHVDTPQRWSLGGSATHHFGCLCFSCSLGYSLRSLQMNNVCSKNCLCSSCAKQRSPAVLMRAHAPRCGCEVCSANVLPRAFHDGSCGYLSRAPSHRAVFPHPACFGSSASMTLGEGTSVDEQVELDVTARAFMQKLKEDPASVSFEDTMSTINEAFDYTPKRFINGAASSEAGVNEGSCKVFSFGKIAGLSETETLSCFGEHYRSVLEDPSGDSHGNIRAFMETGWGGISFPDGGAIHSRRG